MEFNRLNPFLEEREDLRAARIACNIHNASVVREEDLRTPSDYMLPTIDEMIQKDIEREKEEREKEREEIDNENRKSEAQLAWKAYIKRLTEGRTPIQKEIKVVD